MRPYKVYFDVEVYVPIEATDAVAAVEVAEDTVRRNLGPVVRLKRVETVADDGGVDEVVV